MRMFACRCLSGASGATGYARTEMVELPGQFAVRGGIVDIFSPKHRGQCEWNCWRYRWSRCVSSTRGAAIDCAGELDDGIAADRRVGGDAGRWSGGLASANLLGAGKRCGHQDTL